ncbi:unnamed protein product [Schistosoma mattheei]|uniref:Uncharacterized protein n=1 Tax=Schistosoma mattheei TaxID=31246 RepID=A0A183NJ05_9TREM|nr:unnamed protein product [Schistosoma mattheei]
MHAINSAASAENWEIDSKASVQEAWTLFKQLYNRESQPHLPWTVPKKKKHGHPSSTDKLKDKSIGGSE